jgi:hypothetical protein
MPAKIIKSESWPQELEQPKGPATQQPAKTKEITVTPEPKTGNKERDNWKARRLAQAAQRQQENAYAPRRKLSKGQKKARRRRIRECHYKAVQADLASGVISEEEAKKRLPRRQSPRMT